MHRLPDASDLDFVLISRSRNVLKTSLEIFLHQFIAQSVSSLRVSNCFLGFQMFLAKWSSGLLTLVESASIVREDIKALLCAVFDPHSRVFLLIDPLGSTLSPGSATMTPSVLFKYTAQLCRTLITAKMSFRLAVKDPKACSRYKVLNAWKEPMHFVQASKLEEFIPNIEG